MKRYAADASDDENLVPGTSAPPSEDTARTMRALIDAVTELYPGTHVMVAVMEPAHERFNYASNVRRVDMMAMLKALLKRLRHEVN